MVRPTTMPEVENHRAVKEVRDGYLRVRPYGNCSLFNGIAKSDQLRLQNVAIIEGDGEVPDLKVNIEAL